MLTASHRPSIRMNILRVQHNGTLRCVLCVLVIFLGVLPILWCLFMLKSGTQSLLIRSPPLILKSDLENLHGICSLVMETGGVTMPHNDKNKLQVRLDRCAQHIKKLITENDRAQKAFENGGLGVLQKPESQKDVELCSVSHNISHRTDRELRQNVQTQRAGQECRQHSCFDYSRCLFTSPFLVYFYKESEVKLQNGRLDPFTRDSVTRVMTANSYITSDLRVACVYLVLVDGASNRWKSRSTTTDINLSKLPSWKDTGRNHVLLNLARNAVSHDIRQHVESNSAIVVQASFHASQFRPGFDIVVPLLLGNHSRYKRKEVPQITAKRKYLLSFQGVLSPHHPQSPGNINGSSDSTRRKSDRGTGDAVQRNLSKLRTSQGSRFYIKLNCPPLYANYGSINFSEWLICADSKRLDILKSSTFVLIIAPDHPVVSSAVLQMRLYEALKCGAIPVLLGEQIHLPFSEYISWEKAAVILPKARVAEISYFLSSIHEADVVSLRRQGWFIWMTYLSSTKAVIDGILATIRTRLSLPAAIAPRASTRTIISMKCNTNQSSKAIVQSGDSSSSAKHVQRYLRNFTHPTIARELSWNTFPGPFHRFPATPLDPVLPSDSHFGNSGQTFEPIGNGSGGIGKTFRESLGGNFPTEQFTVVILTYNRLQLLISLLEHFVGLPYLNKVLVVWNSPKLPPSDISWPRIHVPIKIVKTMKNSLNNRFLPYDEIETEAILSLDDDIELPHDDLIFAFRVWRENRDRIVGFPSRFHAWDVNTNNGFLYNSNKSCELSMVLTGAAFFHVYYAYLYSNMMPKVIRDKVDQYMNCEDIAMNFLVSHITRKPPIKVTGRTDFICRTCEKVLWKDVSHFSERHKCLRFFAKVYGYTPLLYTQFRADSVLYRTSETTSCYRYV